MQQAAGDRRQSCLRLAAQGQPPGELVAAQTRPPVLVARRLPKTQNKKRGELHQKFRACGRRRCQAPSCRRLGVRPYTSRRDHHHQRQHLQQRRRLAGELHRTGRTLRRFPAFAALGRRATRGEEHLGAQGYRNAGAASMNIAIVTDAWQPQVNGVVTTLGKTGAALEQMCHRVRFVTPEGFKTFPCPTYPSIRLALNPIAGVRETLDAFTPDAVHIATEGPLGWAARAYCRSHGLNFTTSFHTQMPEYIRLRAPLPLALSYSVLRHFHGAAVRTMVPTESQRQRLQRRGFNNVVIWSRGVDTALLRPTDKPLLDAPRPNAMYKGKVAMEKNIGANIELRQTGTKYVIGDGPELDMLRQRYPEVRFTGFK